jgi:PUA domain protein
LRIYNLSKKTRDELAQNLSDCFGWKRTKLSDLKAAENEDPSFTILFDTSENLFLLKVAQSGNSTLRYVPLLRDEQVLPLLPVVIVDSGAVKFVCNGANVMRPGIVKIGGQFRKSDLVVIHEEKYGKAISVGRALESSQIVENMQRGTAIENLHYVGDRYWEALKQIVH